ncbi:MAG TPA: GspE/PulE family protein, partial [bacterium]|nr:GspE/PulE family protein [bacterium]
NLIAIQQDEEKMVIAIADPNNLAALDDISLMLGFYVEAVIAPKNEILANLDTYYAATATDDFSDALADLTDDDVSVVEGGLSSQDASAQDGISDAPAIKWVSALIRKALQDRASDIHLEPFERSFRVRERIDGVLINVPPPPRNLKDGIVSRIKVMAELNIADNRLPQDGSIRLKKIGNKSIDLRVACLPTVNGEAVVLRVLDKSAVLLSMNDLGLSPHIEKEYRKALNQPNGIIMVTGPTGCGKTTTLYAGMLEINDLQSKVITVEDPVEYEIYGMMQCQVNEKIGMTFANALRAILRQDPDIILIGEMRDPETAGIAIEAALTGHLVLSTTHTNEAAGTITRLIDMGCEPFLITSTIQTIIGQRLVRTICSNCKTEYKPAPELFLKLGKRPEEYANQKFYKGEGCEHCTRTGYYGRTGIFEVFEMREALMEL